MANRPLASLPITSVRICLRWTINAGKKRSCVPIVGKNGMSALNSRTRQTVQQNRYNKTSVYRSPRYLCACKERRHLGRARTKWRLSLQRSEEHTSELQSLMRISYAVFCLKKKNKYQDRNLRKN